MILIIILSLFAIRGCFGQTLVHNATFCGQGYLEVNGTNFTMSSSFGRMNLDWASIYADTSTGGLLTNFSGKASSFSGVFTGSFNGNFFIYAPKLFAGFRFSYGI